MKKHEGQDTPSAAWGRPMKAKGMNFKAKEDDYRRAGTPQVEREVRGGPAGLRALTNQSHIGGASGKIS